MKHIFNWHRDLPDYRDFKYALHMLKVSQTPTVLPIKIDLRRFCSPVYDQGQYGSCTSQSLAGHLEFLELKEIRENTAAPEEFDSKSFIPFSRLFIYYNERVIENTVNTDAGAQIRDGIKSLMQWGDCKESNWCYLPSNVFSKPTDVAYQEGLQHKISNYMSLNNLDEIRHCLNDGYVVSFGFSVYSSFESSYVANTGIVPIPSINEDLEGGHAVLAVGYDDINKWLIVRNSWGETWGDQGYFYLPYEFIINGNLASDYWTIRK